MLAEMFPEASSLEIRNCLTVSNGDVESAVQLMLLKKENIDDEGKENHHQVLDLSPEVCVGLYRFTVCAGSRCLVKVVSRRAIILFSWAGKMFQTVGHKIITCTLANVSDFE